MKVKPGVGEQTETVWLIDWENPQANHFVVAEEVTVAGPAHQAPRRRAVRQRHRARDAGAEAIDASRCRRASGRPSATRSRSSSARSSRPSSSSWLATTSRALRYAVIDTPEKYWLNWRLITDIDPVTRAQIDAELAGIEGRLDQALVQLVPSTDCWRSSTTSSSSTPASRRPAGRTSTSASRLRRSGSRGARAASSGTPRGRASRSPWSGWPSGSASTSRMPASC